MTPNHTPGSGEIAERIRKAWLAANPEPTYRCVTEFVGTISSYSVWRGKFDRLNKMLACEAYESAVIQFLVPEGYDWSVDNWNGDLHDCAGWVGSKTNNPAAEASGNTPAEALLAAIEETSRDRG